MDSHPVQPHFLENKLLKLLSKPVTPPGCLERPSGSSSSGISLKYERFLENKLLKQFDSKSSILTKPSKVLPLKSSILAKHEKHQVKRKKLCASPMLGSPPYSSPSQLSLMTIERGFAFDDHDEFEEQTQPHTSRSTSKTLISAKRSIPAVAFGAGVMLGSGDESWALLDSHYDFKGVDLAHEFDDRPNWTSTEDDSCRALEETRATKLRFLNTVCVSLVSQANFKDKLDPMRTKLMQQGKDLAATEPEFILKAALYARQELHLRSTANFLLSLAALLEPCRPFLRKYYTASIRLPTDWIETAELYQIFDDTKLNFGSLPAALRKVMRDRFAEFDNYQLAKYNRAKKKPIGTAKSCVVSLDVDNETEEQRQRRVFTIKQLVRLLHVSRPVEPVMAIIGKRYPADPDAFRRSGLPGMFDSTRSNKRMKLPTPETWETQVAQHGNKAAVWQQLIDHKKLPYMAMLRNIRNMIIANIGCAHHEKVLKTLTSQKAVLNSKQMVFRFLSAYTALDELEVNLTNNMVENNLTMTNVTRPKSKHDQKSVKQLWWDRKKRALRSEKQKIKYDVHLIQQYRAALDRAVDIATVHNVPPIAGRTVIFCDVSNRMDHLCASAKGLGRPKTARTMALLLSLMCQRSSESCDLLLLGSGQPKPVLCQPRENLLKQADQIERKLGGFLSDSVSESGSEHDESADSTSAGGLEVALDDFLAQRRWLDNVVAMGAGATSGKLNRTLDLYRHLVNPNLLFVNVDLTRPASVCSSDDQLSTDHRNVSLFGFSDQILRFVAERGTSGQLAAVDAIDLKYNLRRDIRLPAIDLREAVLASQVGVGMTRWRTVRVFISSTFLDMHGERDLLIRHVLPELRSRARALRLDLQVVDLRWGITASEAEGNKQLEMCLSEIDRCQLFVGVLGARYGRPLSTYPITDGRLLEFVSSQPAGLSLTALEMLYATRDEKRARQTAVFYQRSDDLLSSVPGRLMERFSDLAPGRRRVAELRSAIQQRGCVITPYTAAFGYVSGVPVATNLQAFGEGVMESLWNTMESLYPLEATTCDLVTEDYTMQHEFAMSQQLVGRKNRLQRVVEEVERGQGRFVMVTGKPGSGKTCFLGRAYSELSDKSDHLTRLLVPVFCSAGGQCRSSADLLAYLRSLLARQPLRAAPRQQLAAELAELLAVRGRRQHVVLVLDGLDELWQTEAELAADWLPDQLPKNVTVLISADDGGGLYRRINSMLRLVNIPLGSLDLSERSGLVRDMLHHHSKTLEESAWNNQLRTLTSKRGAGDPLYLRLACEEIRTFGVYEQLSGKLSSLGQTVAAITLDVIQRLEETYGLTAVRLSLCAVTISPHGLTEDDLFEFLKSRSCGLGPNGSQPLTQFAFTSLLRSGESILQRSSAPGQPALLCVAHAEMTRVIRSRYMVGPQGPAAVRELATWLAEFYEQRCSLLCDDFNWQIPPNALQVLPYFWGLTEDMDGYRRAICSLRFLLLKSQSGLAGELLADVRAANVADSPARQQYLQHPNVQQVVEFVSHNLHLLNRSPSVVLQQALNEPTDSWLRGRAEQVCLTSALAATALLRLTNQSRASVLDRRPCDITIRPGEAVTAATADADTDQLFVGLSSGGIKMYDLVSCREVRSFVGHGDPITGLIMLSHGAHLVSGSTSGQLSVWKVSSGQRLAVTTAHRRRVAGLACRPGSDEFVSVGWSCDAKLWRFRASSSISALGGGELQELRALCSESRPLSCVSHHPSQPVVATGGWDGKIKIWNTTDMQRKAVRHGHETSISCVAISHDANYIISGDIDGYLIVWGTKHGDAIQRCLVHVGPVQAVGYLSDGRFVTAGADGDVKVWRAHVGKEVRRVSAESAILVARAVAGGAMLTVSWAGEVALEPTGSGQPRWSRHLDNITSAVCDQLRAYLAVGRAVHVLKMADGRPERQLSLDVPVTSLACLSDGAEDARVGMVFVGLEDGRVGFALADRGEIFTTLGHAGEVTSLSVTMGCNGEGRLASGGRDGMVLIWCTEQLHTPLHSLGAYQVPVSAVAWFGSRLVTAGQNSEMHVYDSGDDFAESRVLTGNNAPVRCFAVTDTHLLSTTTSGQVLLWTSQLVAVTEQQCLAGSLPDLTRLPDGILAALLPRHDATVVIDLQKMNCMGGFSDHTAGVSTVATTKQSLLSASLDGSVKMWHTEQTGVWSMDAGILAMHHLWTADDRATCYLATVRRNGLVVVLKYEMADGQTPAEIYTAHISDKSLTLLDAALGDVSRSSAGVLRFSALCLSADTAWTVSVVVPVDGAAGSHQLNCWPRRPGTAPPLCLAVGDNTSCLMVADADGRVTVYDEGHAPHALYQCGSGPDPSLMLIRVLNGSTVVTCDRSGMLCRLEQTKRLNVIRATWEPVLPAARLLTPPTPGGCQLPHDATRYRYQADEMELDQARPNTDSSYPSALLVTDTEAVLGDSGGRLWCRAGDEYCSTKTHSGAVTWVGHDPTRADIIYTSGSDRRLVVWLRQPSSPQLQQVGEFEFASCVRHCLLLPAAVAGQPTHLLCGDDRGRLHCLQADLSRIAAAGAAYPPPPQLSAAIACGGAAAFGWQPAANLEPFGGQPVPSPGPFGLESAPSSRPFGRQPVPNSGLFCELPADGPGIFGSRPAPSSGHMLGAPPAAAQSGFSFGAGAFPVATGGTPATAGSPQAAPTGVVPSIFAA